jgi:type VII secretion protein EccB
MLDEPMRAQTRSLIVGCVIALLTVAGCAIAAMVRPQHELGDAPIVMVKESGALYVRIADVWHPVLNLASARLIVGSAATPAVVVESALQGSKRGATLGIPGAPTDLPDPLSSADSRWAVCDDAQGTTVVAGPAVGELRLEPLRGGHTELVRSRTEAATYLLYDGRRARVDTADPAVMKALRADDVEPSVVSSAVLNAVPEAPPIARPVIPRVGRPSAMPGIPVGTVVRVDRSDIDELYVALADGVQRVGHVVADVIRFGDSQGAAEIVAVAADAVSRATTVERLAVATYPDTVATPLAAPTVCAQWLPLLGDEKDGRSDVLVGSAVSLPAGQAAVAQPWADGAGPNVDAVFVPPGRCLYAQADYPYLVSDTGTRFGIPNAEAAAALGFPARGVPAPWPILKVLVEGPELSRGAALAGSPG